MGRLGRFFARGSGLTDEQAAAALPAARVATLTHTYFLPYFWMFFSILACVGPMQHGNLPPAEVQAIIAAGFPGLIGLGALLARRKFRALHQTPLAAGEVEAFPSAAYDDLERAYLALIFSAVHQKVPVDAEPEVRNALRALGEAIDRLPGVPPVTDTADDLESQANALRAQAGADDDAVVAESLLRRADSLLRRADTVRRSAQFARRALAVREEILAQIETLRAGVAAFDTGAGDVGDLKHLAESVRRVAVEADSLAAAREELDAFLGEPLPPSVAGAAAPVQVVQNKG